MVIIFGARNAFRVLLAARECLGTIEALVRVCISYLVLLWDSKF